MEGDIGDGDVLLRRVAAHQSLDVGTLVFGAGLQAHQDGGGGGGYLEVVVVPSKRN
jgi:hypothetical protein